MGAALFDCVGVHEYVRLHALPLEWQMHPYKYRASFWRTFALKELGRLVVCVNVHIHWQDSMYKSLGRSPEHRHPARHAHVF
jgi:hypothetical protein